MTYAARLNTYYTRKTEHRCTRCGAELEPGRIIVGEPIRGERYIE